MAGEFTQLLLRTALCTSMAIILLLLVRKPLRHSMGGRLAYESWLTVPLVAIAAILPGSSTPTLIMTPVLEPVRTIAAHAIPAMPARIDVCLLVWAAGALSLAVGYFLGHWRFLRTVGRLTRLGEAYRSEVDVGPASVGLFAPRIIVPHDFLHRYTPQEQALVIAHEKIHISRRDAVANLLVAIFQCVFWFNPLMYLAARCLRHDQELACDALVMQQNPHQRRAYAEALLKFHTGAVEVRASINCHWQTNHPTKERLMNLQKTPIGIVRRLAGRCLVASLAISAVFATVAVKAEQAALAPTYAVAMTLDAAGEKSTPRVLARDGEKFALRSGDWRIEMAVRQAKTPGDIWMVGKIFKGNEILSTPTLLVRLNEKAGIKVGDEQQPFSLSMIVSPQP